MEKIITKNFKETEEFAFKLASKIDSGLCIELIGDLGAGKTVFAKGFAKGLDVDSTILSPTFALVNSYDGRLKLNHFDLYRISDFEELEILGFEEMFLDRNAVNLIEWPQIAYDILPKDRMRIEIFKINENEREIVVTKL